MTGADESLELAIQQSLDGLLHALELESPGGERFRVRGEPGRFDRVFGGQVLAQALLAAGATVDGKAPQSLHAYFVEAGAPGETLDLVVDRLRDGRSISSRSVTVRQGERTLLTMLASFHDTPGSPVFAEPPPPTPGPDELPVLQDWVHRSPDLGHHSRTWVDHPPPLDLRIGEAPTFLGGARTGGPRSHWMRLPRDIGDDPLLQAALLAYASDYLLLDMAFRSFPQDGTAPPTAGFSLDHTLWFHRPVRFDRWHLHTQETVTITGHRGLIRGAIHDDEGHLVASAMQEVLVRPALR